MSMSAIGPMPVEVALPCEFEKIQAVVRILDYTTAKRMPGNARSKRNHGDPKHILVRFVSFYY